MTFEEVEDAFDAAVADNRCSDRCCGRWQQYFCSDDESNTYHAKIRGEWRVVEALGRGPMQKYCAAHRAVADRYAYVPVKAAGGDQ